MYKTKTSQPPQPAGLRLPVQQQGDAAVVPLALRLPVLRRRAARADGIQRAVGHLHRVGAQLRRQGVLPRAPGRQGGHPQRRDPFHRRKVAGRRRRQGRGENKAF